MCCINARAPLRCPSPSLCCRGSLTRSCRFWSFTSTSCSTEVGFSSLHNYCIIRDVLLQQLRSLRLTSWRRPSCNCCHSSQHVWHSCSHCVSALINTASRIACMSASFYAYLVSTSAFLRTKSNYRSIERTTEQWFALFSLSSRLQIEHCPTGSRTILPHPATPPKSSAATSTPLILRISKVSLR